MSQLQLLTKKRFLPLFITQFLGAFNDNIFKNAFVILLTFKGGGIAGLNDSQMVALTGGIFILPFFLFSAQAGQLADKFEKTQIIRWVKIAEIAMMVVAIFGFLEHNIYLLLTVVFLLGLHSTVFGPIKYSILPQHLHSDELVGANGLVEAATFIAILLGTIGGGTLIAIEPWGPVIVCIFLLVCAVLGWAASVKIPEAPAVSPQLKFSWNPITPTWQTFQSSRKSQSVFNSILGISWFWFLGSAFLSLFPTYCKDWLHADETVVTLFLATFSVGIGLGSMLCERLSRRTLELGLVPFGSFGMSVFAVDLFLVGRPELRTATAGIINIADFFSHAVSYRIIFDLLAFSVFSGFFIVPLYTLIQVRSDKSERSRVIATNNILNAFFMVVAAVFLMLLSGYNVPTPTVFLILSILNIAVAIYIYLLIPEFLLRFIVWCLANIIYRMRVIGEENIPSKGAAVLVCNHVSFVDWMIIAAGVHRPVRFVMDHSYFKGLFIKGLMTRAKVIPIAKAKEDPEILQRAFAKVAEELRHGQIVCIFPEGTITRDGALNPFKPGIERIVKETAVPVIPMALGNMWGSVFSRKGGKALVKVPRRFWSRITLIIDKPISPEQVKSGALQDRVRDMLNG